MSQENINFTKIVYNNKEFDDLYDRNFSSLIRVQRPINIERFFTLYKELFYKIQRTGLPEDISSTGEDKNKSHWELILESQDYLNNYIDWRDKKINSLFDELGVLDEIFQNKQFINTNYHPQFPDGTFLRSPARNANGLPIWVMQNGVKREIKNYDTYKSLKRAARHKYSDSDDDVCELLEISTLDDILDGPYISVDTDINSMNWESTDLDITLGGITDYIESEITCLEGVDIDDKSPWNSTQYQPRYNSCKIEYTSLDIIVPGNSKETTETIFPGDSKTIKYRANTDINISSLTVLEGFTQEYIIKNTKKELRAPIKKDVYGNHIDELGNYIYKYYDLPGWPFGLKEQRKSSYGTYQVQSLDRNTDTSKWLPFKDHNWNNPTEQLIQQTLWDEVLNDASNVYYNNTISWNGYQGPLGGLYGEPIYYLSNPIGEEEGHNNLFAVKLGTDNILLDDENNENQFWGVQYYVILNKDFESNHTKRIKTSLNHHLTPYILNIVGGYNNLKTKTFVELEQMADELKLPKQLLTNNWRIFMDNPTRSNQQKVYPGFNNL
tara:strand:+ start:273 stop:1931 length:1659 start_codon:yes stop_codon:yes gene_type:complete